MLVPEVDPRLYLKDARSALMVIGTIDSFNSNVLDSPVSALLRIPAA